VFLVAHSRMSHMQVSGTSESNATSPEHHALVLPSNGGKRVHPVPYLDGGLPGMIANYL
jgi:hypothetical protein